MITTPRLQSHAPRCESFKTNIVNLVQVSVQNGVCFDLFLFPNGYMDIATIGVLASTTGGAIYRYPFFKTGTDTAKVVADCSKMACSKMLIRLQRMCGKSLKTCAVVRACFGCGVVLACVLLTTMAQCWSTTPVTSSLPVTEFTSR